MARIDAQKEIAGANMAMKHISDTQRNDKEQKIEGFRQGMDMNKLYMNHEHQRNQNDRQQIQNAFQQQSKPPQKGKDKK
jgi:hypothetical protein